LKARTIICSAALLALSAGTAQAQNFTFDSAANPATTVGGPGANGAIAVATHWTGTSTATWADGKKTTDKYTCISMTQPSNDKVFDMHVMCDATGPNGNYSSVWGCQFTSKDMLSTGCVGGLTGRTGTYAGRGGTITFMGRSGNGSGTGTWGPAPAAN
jgi:hypothetical protein